MKKEEVIRAVTVGVAVMIFGVILMHLSDIIWGVVVLAVAYLLIKNWGKKEAK